MPPDDIGHDEAVPHPPTDRPSTDLNVEWILALPVVVALALWLSSHL